MVPVEAAPVQMGERGALVHSVASSYLGLFSSEISVVPIEQ